MTEEFWTTAGPARVSECLAAGYYVHDRSNNGTWTILHHAAAFSDDPEVIEVLIEAGADLEASFSPLDRTPLHTAARYNRNPEIVRVLLRLGANPNAVNEPGRTPLHLAALFNENPAVVEELLRVTDVNARAASGGETPLHGAARRWPNVVPMAGDPSPAVVEVLLMHGADVSAKTLDGRTPLVRAETQAAADLIQRETQRRAATMERFLRLVGTWVVAGAVALAVLVSLIRVGANRPGAVSWPATHGRF
ncbi:MAG: ankyrin repeat domain-containing protein [Gemmatimonadetes bacterium]|nr:ankyrin repeat domain-containing protein [Gemmatimonadota bacterium]